MTTWDLDKPSLLGADLTQETVTRPRNRNGAVATIILLAGCFVSSSDATTIISVAPSASSSIIAVRSESRTPPPAPSRAHRSTARSTSSEFDPDTDVGMSTLRLSKLGTGLFTVCEESDADCDYSFG